MYFNAGLDFQTILELFQVTIDDILANANNDVVIIGGGFNARVGRPELLPIEMFKGPCLENNGINSDLTVSTVRGRPSMDFMKGNGFVLVYDRTQSDCPAEPTFCSASSSSVIDLVFVNVTGLSSVKDLHVVEGRLSDHFTVTLTLCHTNLREN